MAAKKNFPLRLDPKLYEVLERWAADEFRSVNSHIEYLLRDAAARAGRLSSGRPSAAPSGPESDHDGMRPSGDGDRNN
ncbi:hypothetical protein PAESOLCIP111_01920 [Paenibacillus solanacearum]|uniref:Toxin-antitoxin system HicB family antitoxin n=1 Tax=Paenibacillus solanacearum TaxID=2048548 RepID=A0A916JYP8_9BACL|nr:hypothetical protein [Paenibacillus solanacearum]CAG7616570.1 hypothetical protein PAESOLCIP111_01920 [Paenibacillus solanacearum]